MVLAGDGNFYIAARNGTTLNYYKVSGSTKNKLAAGALPSVPNNKYSYALDGEGRLYAINSSAEEVIVYNNSGARISNATVYGANSSGHLLGFANRVLARNGTHVYEITISGSTVSNNTNRTDVTYSLLTACTDTSTNNKGIDGAGTNFIRCAFDDGSNRFLYSLKYDKDNNRYDNAAYSISIQDVDWASGKALVYNSSTVFLCTTTESPTVGISCNDIGAPTLDTTLLRDGNNNKYLKSDGTDKVLYISGGTAKVGELLGPPDKVQYLLTTNISGGSASFDLNRFAYIPGSGSCLTLIAYLSSRTGFPKAYTIEQPSGACLKGILKVY
jgi:hypothetical protein